MVAWEVLLSKGQQWDWFGDPFFRVQTLAAMYQIPPEQFLGPVGPRA